MSGTRGLKRAPWLGLSIAAAFPLLVGAQTAAPTFVWGTAGVASDTGHFLGRQARSVTAERLQVTVGVCQTSPFTRIWLGLRYGGPDSLRFDPKAAALEAVGAKPRALKYRSPAEVERLIGTKKLRFEVGRVSADELDKQVLPNDRDRERVRWADSSRTVLMNQATPETLTAANGSTKGELFFELPPKDTELRFSLATAVGRFVIPVGIPPKCG